MESRWPVTWVYRSEMAIKWSCQTFRSLVSGPFIRLCRCPPPHTVPGGVSNHFHTAQSGAWRTMWDPVEAHSLHCIHTDWGWHHTDVLAFSRLGGHQLPTPFCGLRRSWNIFQLPSMQPAWITVVIIIAPWTFFFPPLTFPQIVTNFNAVHHVTGKINK